MSGTNGGPLRPIFASIGRLFRNPLFVISTAAPTALAILYFGFIASDVYVSESRFVVRSPNKESASPLGLILKGTGFSASGDDSYAVQDFITSRDALKTLDQELHLGQSFGSPKVDFFNRFAALDRDDSFEALHQYYQKKVGVDVDTASSIVTLTTRAFSSEDAYAINRRLIELAENLVNQLNERGRADMIRFASREVEETEKGDQAAALALASYRNQKGVIDPEKQSAIPLSQVATLQDQLIDTQTQLAQIETVAVDNPQIPVLQQRVHLLQSAIEAENSRVAGVGAGFGSLAGKAAEYQRLSLSKEFADRLLASALTTLEQARQDAQRQQLYLERIVQPSKPDKALEPRRIRSIVATFLLGLILWGVLTLLVGAIREHRD
jgi:capsular polysaccharide transport system permease protein